MKSNKNKLIMMIIVIFIIMPINGFLFTRNPIWFPLLLIIAQMPFVISTLMSWYKQIESEPRPGHRNPPNPPRERNDVEL